MRQKKSGNSARSTRPEKIIDLPQSDGDSSQHVPKAMRRHGELALVIFVALVVGICAMLLFETQNKKTYIQSMTHEAETMLALTSSYVSAYSGLHGKFEYGSLPVPAAFRATATELFNEKNLSGERLVAKMVGVPGREIATAPLDAQMGFELNNMINTGQVKNISRLMQVRDQPVLRSLFPSIATKQSCVNCHNDLQAGQQIWKKGDLMGAFVIDRGVGEALHRIRSMACFVGLAFFALAILTLLMIRQHFDLRRKSTTLQSLANTDPLTGCLNRRALFSEVNVQFDSSCEYGALLALDIDNFKHINDRYGHSVGDEVLVQFAERVRRCLRKSDVFARTGGEEFLVYLPNACNQELNKIANRILSEVSKETMQVGSRELKVTVSIGGVKMKVDRRFTFEHYMKVADNFLYQAKQAGRNQLVSL